MKNIGDLILEKHLRNSLFLSICWFLVNVFDSGMNFVFHQNFCFALLAERASLCSSDQLPKAVGATLLPLCPILFSNAVLA